MNYAVIHFVIADDLGPNGHQVISNHHIAFIMI